MYISFSGYILMGDLVLYTTPFCLKAVGKMCVLEKNCIISNKTVYIKAA